MFADESLIAARERAAVLALMARRAVPWNRLAGMIEEAESALRLLDSTPEPGAQQALLSLEKDESGEHPPAMLDKMQVYVDRLRAEGISVISVLDPEYPTNLRMVHDRPAALFVRGTLDERDARSVAVVGTRKASDHGLEAARAMVGNLLAGKYAIVSGLAAGIDTAAHVAALDVGARTVAVIGTGLRVAFPAANRELQDRIATESAVVSQFWPGQGARRWTFPQRNAVMSGFARATVVIEASHTSGARLQARLASEHGRPVFLLKSLMIHDWARAAAERPTTYVVDGGEEVVEHLSRLYESELLVTS